MTMTLEQLHDWITRLPGPFQPARRQTDAIEAAIRERDRLRGTPVPKVEWQELTERAERAEVELAEARETIKRLLGQNKVQYDFLSSRQCPDHAGKWERGKCLQCALEKAEAELAALKARIGASRLIEPGAQFSVPGYVGKRVRMLVED